MKNLSIETRMFLSQFDFIKEFPNNKQISIMINAIESDLYKVKNRKLVTDELKSLITNS